MIGAPLIGRGFFDKSGTYSWFTTPLCTRASLNTDCHCSTVLRVDLQLLPDPIYTLTRSCSDLACDGAIGVVEAYQNNDLFVRRYVPCFWYLVVDSLLLSVRGATSLCFWPTPTSLRTLNNPWSLSSCLSQVPSPGTLMCMATPKQWAAAGPTNCQLDSANRSAKRSWMGSLTVLPMDDIPSPPPEGMDVLLFIAA